MAIAVPVIGWAIGGLAFTAEFSALGASIGWLVGSWVVGGMGEEATFDPGLQEMPLINNSLRGVTMPVIFGTVRCSANIIYRDGYTVDKNTYSQGGGSGGGGVETTEYTYFLDFIFHFGMVYKPAKLKGAFIGPKAINNNSLSQIITTSDGEGFTEPSNDPLFDHFSWWDVEGDTLKVEADEAYFYGGADADSTETGWAYFNSQVGGSDIRWPSTVWLGFRQLNLGAQPSIPNLNAILSTNDTLLEFSSSPTTPTIVDQYSGGSNTDRYYGRSRKMDKYGQSYWSDVAVSTGDLTVVDKNGNLVVYWDEATLISKAEAFCSTAYGDSTIVLNGKTSLYGSSCSVIGDGDYIVLMTSVYQGWSATETQVNIILLQANSAAEPSVVGFCRFNGRGLTSVGTANMYNHGFFEIAGTWDNLDALIMGYSCDGISGNNMVCFFMPSVNQLLASSFTTWWSGNSYSPATAEVPYVRWTFPAQSGPDAGSYTASQVSTNWFTVNLVGYGRNSNGPCAGGFCLPYLGSTYRCAIYFGVNSYLHEQLALGNIGASSNDLIEEYARNAEIDPQTTYPGFFLFLDVGTKTVSSVIAYVPDGTNGDDVAFGNSFELLNRSQGLSLSTYRAGLWQPWQEEGYDITGDQTTDAGVDSYYDCAPSIMYRDGTDYYIGFTRSSHATIDVGVSGGNHKWKLAGSVRFFQYKRNTGRFFNENTVGGVIADMQADWGIGDTVAVDFDESCYLLWKEGTNDLYFIGHGNQARNSVTGFGGVNYWGGLYGSLNDQSNDITPPEIIKEILTNDFFGVGFTTAQLDLNTYTAAVAYCVTNEIYVSTQFRQTQSYLQFIELCLAIYGGYLTWSGSKIKFGYVDDNETPIRTIDNDHLLVELNAEGDMVDPVNISRGALQDTYNQVRVNYLDRNIAYRQNAVEVGDEVDQDINGIRLREFPPQFVMSEQTAGKLATRTLWSNLYSRQMYQFTLGPKDCDLEPGDIVTLVDSFSGLNQDVRIVAWQETDRMKFRVRAVDLIGYDVTADYSVNSAFAPGPTSPIGTASLPQDFVIYELPKEYESNNPRLYWSWLPGGRDMAAHMMASPDNTTYQRIGQKTNVYPHAGTLLQALPNDRSFIENVDVVLFPSSGYNTSSSLPLAIENETLPTVQAAGRALGQGAFWVGSEMLAYEDAVLVGGNKYVLERVYRGWGGTHIHEHSSGDMFHLHNYGGVGYVDYTTDQIGTSFYYKARTFGFGGDYSNISSTDPKQYTIQGVFYRPQVLDNLYIYVGSGDGTYPEEIPLPRGPVSNSLYFMGGSNIRNVGSSQYQNITVTWEDGARDRGYGTGGYGLDGTGGSGYGRFSQDVTSHSWRVTVTGSGDTVVRSTVVTTPFFEYSKADNIADNGAWRGNVAIAVTPFNDYGDALRYAVRSLELS